MVRSVTPEKVPGTALTPYEMGAGRRFVHSSGTGTGVGHFNRVKAGYGS